MYTRLIEAVFSPDDDGNSVVKWLGSKNLTTMPWGNLDVDIKARYTTGDLCGRWGHSLFPHRASHHFFFFGTGIRLCRFRLGGRKGYVFGRSRSIDGLFD